MSDAAYLIGVTAQSEAPTLPESAATHAVLAAVRAAPPGPWLLAVSGGLDSMALLDAVAACSPAQVAAVACFDHGTGRFARRAVAHVSDEAAERGLPFVTGVLGATDGRLQTEARWRAARWRFLIGWAREFGATVLTAHTSDDQAETVALRILRGAGARGLAAMAGVDLARGIARPLLGVTRADVAAYATSRDVRFVEDPSNDGRRHARNRMRHDILPALEHTSPGFSRWLLDLAARAASWRAEVDALVEGLVLDGTVTFPSSGLAVLRADRLAACGTVEWSVLWPPIAARVGVTMDRRGLARAAEWAHRASASTVGSVIQLAGGAEIARTRQGRTLVFRASAHAASTSPGTT